MLHFLRPLFRWQPAALRRLQLSLHPTCAACGTRRRLEAHHVVPYHVEPARELELSNLLTLCERCHLFVGNLGAWQSHNPDARTDAAAWLTKVKTRP